MTLAPLRVAPALCACLLLALLALLAVCVHPAWGATDPADEPVAETGEAGESDAADAAAPSARDLPGLQTARFLIDNGRYEQALVIVERLARSHPDHPRRTDVLFLFGLAATGTALGPDVAEEERERLLDLAVAAFRVILNRDPSLVRVRLELARAFYHQGEDDLAREHFEWVLAGDVPPPVVANVRRFLEAIRARRRWSYNAGLALLPDSNLGGTSGERIIYIYGLPFVRDDEDLVTSGIGLSVWGGAEYQAPLGPQTRLRAGGTASRREYSHSRFDETYASVHLGPRVLLDRDTEASVLATASQRWAGTVKDHHALGTRLEVGHRFNTHLTLSGGASWQGRRYRTQGTLDGPVADLSLGAGWVITPTLRLDFSAGYGRERPASTRARNASKRIGAGVSVILPEGFTLGGGAEYRRTDYGSGWFPHVPDNGARVDRTRSLRASLHNRGITVLGFSPEVSLVYEKRDTNAQLHDFERTRGELRFVRQF